MIYENISHLWEKKGALLLSNERKSSQRSKESQFYTFYKLILIIKFDLLNFWKYTCHTGQIIVDILIHSLPHL